VTDDFDAENGKATFVQNNSRHAHGLIHEADHLLRSAPVTRLVYPCVHSGFIEAYNLVRDGIIEKVIEVLERQIDKSINRCHEEDDYTNGERAPFVLPKIYVTGHSLGGGMFHSNECVKCIIVLVSEFQTRTTNITFISAWSTVSSRYFLQYRDHSWSTN
jgi:hypothetical protein